MDMIGIVAAILIIVAIGISGNLGFFHWFFGGAFTMFKKWRRRT